MKRGSHLYVARYAGEVWRAKVGRSDAPPERICSLGASHDFGMELYAVFPGRGYLEEAVHKRLASKRSERGRGREWFEVSPADAVALITHVIDTHKRVVQTSFFDL